MAVSLAVSLLYREWWSAPGCARRNDQRGLGSITYRVCRDAGEPRSYRIHCRRGWMIAAVRRAALLDHRVRTPDDVAGIRRRAFMSSLENFENPLHAVFESMSCYTTTSLTMATHEPSIGKGLLFYRSITTWFGGAGMIVLSLAILPRPGSAGGMHIYASETSGPRARPSILGTARDREGLLAGGDCRVPIVSMFIFAFDHVDLRAINHSMAAMGTGGVSTQDDGIDHPVRAEVHVPPMILGTVSLPLLVSPHAIAIGACCGTTSSSGMMIGVLAIGTR
jgi:trk system potassium uptake protein TrkH